MTKPADLTTADALRTLAQQLGIPDSAIEDDVVAEFDRSTSGGIGLIRAVRFFSDPDASRLVDAFLNVNEIGGRRAVADACCNIAGCFNLHKAMRS